MPETERRLPNVINHEPFHLDMTPDDDLPVRILRAYRKRCDSRWQVSGLPPEMVLVYGTLNDHQVQRAAILDAAIEKLTGIPQPAREDAR